MSVATERKMEEMLVSIGICSGNFIDLARVSNWKALRASGNEKEKNFLRLISMFLLYNVIAIIVCIVSAKGERS